jgi:hypothetical protein
LLVAQETNAQTAKATGSRALRDHLIDQVNRAPLDRNPFCHIYLDGIFPDAIYPSLLQNLPPAESYSPLNLRLYARPDGRSTRDLFHLTPENLAKLPKDSAAFWASMVSGMTDVELKRTVFAKLAPDLAERFGVAEGGVPDLECCYDVILFRDTEDYRIKPHPDGLNKIVTMQFYLPEDEGTLDLGTSLYRRNRGLLGGSFDEVKRFPFKPNSAYAFAVSDSRTRKSWHGRDRLSGFTGVRNTLMLLFQQQSPRSYAM